MKMTLELDTCTLIVQIVNRLSPRHVDWSYAIFIPKFTGEPIRLSIPQLIGVLERLIKPTIRTKER